MGVLGADLAHEEIQYFRFELPSNLRDHSINLDLVGLLSLTSFPQDLNLSGSHNLLLGVERSDLLGARDHLGVEVFSLEKQLEDLSLLENFA